MSESCQKHLGSYKSQKQCKIIAESTWHTLLQCRWFWTRSSKRAAAFCGAKPGGVLPRSSIDCGKIWLKLGLGWIWILLNLGIQGWGPVGLAWILEFRGSIGYWRFAQAPILDLGYWSSISLKLGLDLILEIWTFGFGASVAPCHWSLGARLDIGVSGALFHWSLGTRFSQILDRFRMSWHCNEFRAHLGLAWRYGLSSLSKGTALDEIIIR